MNLARTSLRLDPHLLAEIKRAAAETHRTMTAVIEDALREVFARRNSRNPGRSKARIPTSGSGGLHPGVDLDDSAALLDLMDGN